MSRSRHANGQLKPLTREERVSRAARIARRAGATHTPAVPRIGYSLSDGLKQATASQRVREYVRRVRRGEVAEPQPEPDTEDAA